MGQGPKAQPEGFYPWDLPSSPNALEVRNPSIWLKLQGG